MNTAALNQDLWPAAEAARAIRAAGSGDWVAQGVAIDSRNIQPGDLFVAIKGPNHDGHAFVADALKSGAAAAVVSDPRMGVEIDASRLLIVDDTMAALEALARAARARTEARIVAITGSVGKTSTKEALRLALGAQPGGAGAVAATLGNLNNHWGLPLSLARMPRDSAYGVFELGMNHPGEIAPLSRITRPHVAIITTVAKTHSAYFDSLEQIADAKAEIFAGLEPGGVAVLNRDNPMFQHLCAAAEAAGVERVVGFGASHDADWRLAEIAVYPEHCDVTARHGDTELIYTLGVSGRHLALNSLAVLAGVEALGGDVAVAAESLSGLRAIAGRGKRHRVQAPGGAFELIDESYNASPASMKAAIAVLGVARPEGRGRRIAVLGDMLELGAEADQLHAALVDDLSAAAIDQVFTSGQSMSALWDALPAAMRGGHANDAEKLTPMVTAAVHADDVVMVKGSLGSRTRIIVEALLDLAARQDAPAGRMANGG